MEAVADLVAGRELDALVAEKVMGHGREGGVYWVQDPPAYSADIGTAWQVVERFVDLGGNMTVYRHLNGASAQAWVPGVAFGFQSMRPVQAETAPLAICRAALAAVGHR